MLGKSQKSSEARTYLSLERLSFFSQIKSDCYSRADFWFFPLLSWGTNWLSTVLNLNNPFKNQRQVYLSNLNTAIVSWEDFLVFFLFFLSIFLAPKFPQEQYLSTEFLYLTIELIYCEYFSILVINKMARFLLLCSLKSTFFVPSRNLLLIGVSHWQKTGNMHKAIAD